MPTFVSREVEFDAGHRVPKHDGKCRNPHGHRYRVVATVTGQLVDRSGASNEGMVVDFGDLSGLLMDQVHDKYDHGFIVYEGDEACKAGLNTIAREGGDIKVIEVDWIPTAENMARAIFEDLYPFVQIMTYDHRVSLYSVEVYETPKARAWYVGG